MKPPRPLLIVAQRLGALRERVVFVGGMVRPILTTDAAAVPPRVTDDVDLILGGVDSPSAYNALGEEPRTLGFREDTSEGAPLCRWKTEDTTADIMPINPAALGFSNAWYDSALLHAAQTDTDAGPIRHLDGPHFCATKLEAFASRGGNDFLHHDPPPPPVQPRPLIQSEPAPAARPATSAHPE